MNESRTAWQIKNERSAFAFDRNEVTNEWQN